MAQHTQIWSYDRSERQGLDEMVNDLHTKATNCEFQEFEGVLRDKLFFSIKDPLMKMKVMGDYGNAIFESVSHCMGAWVIMVM